MSPDGQLTDRRQFAVDFAKVDGMKSTANNPILIQALDVLRDELTDVRERVVAAQMEYASAMREFRSVEAAYNKLTELVEDDEDEDIDFDTDDEKDAKVAATPTAAPVAAERPRTNGHQPVLKGSAAVEAILKERPGVSVKPRELLAEMDRRGWGPPADGKDREGAARAAGNRLRKQPNSKYFLEDGGFVYRPTGSGDAPPMLAAWGGAADEG
jgi:hypothetical protein